MIVFIVAVVVLFVVWHFAGLILALLPFVALVAIGAGGYALGRGSSHKRLGSSRRLGR
jgi:hypothetical protein